MTNTAKKYFIALLAFASLAGIATAGWNPKAIRNKTYELLPGVDGTRMSHYQAKTKFQPNEKVYVIAEFVTGNFSLMGTDDAEIIRKGDVATVDPDEPSDDRLAAPNSTISENPLPGAAPTTPPELTYLYRYEYIDLSLLSGGWDPFPTTDGVLWLKGTGDRESGYTVHAVKTEKLWPYQQGRAGSGNFPSDVEVQTKNFEGVDIVKASVFTPGTVPLPLPPDTPADSGFYVKPGIWSTDEVGTYVARSFKSVWVECTFKVVHTDIRLGTVAEDYDAMENWDIVGASLTMRNIHGLSDETATATGLVNVKNPGGYVKLNHDADGNNDDKSDLHDKDDTWDPDRRDKDLVECHISATGESFQITFGPELRVWQDTDPSTRTRKDTEIANEETLLDDADGEVDGQLNLTLYVEGIGISNLGSPTMMLEGSDGADETKVTVSGVDEDVDSDNSADAAGDDGIDSVDFGKHPEDLIEHEDTKPTVSPYRNHEYGLIIGKNDGDGDDDGVVDWADGFDFDQYYENTVPRPGRPDWQPATDDDEDEGESKLKPLKVYFPQANSDYGSEDAMHLKVVFTYDASDPTKITATETDGVRKYVLPPGTLRLWRRKTSRGIGKPPYPDTSVDYRPSDFIESGKEYFVKDLLAEEAEDSSWDGMHLTLYIEAVRRFDLSNPDSDSESDASPANTIKINVYPANPANPDNDSTDSPGSYDYEYEDEVTICQVVPSLIVDRNHDNEWNSADEPYEDTRGALMLAGFHDMDNHPRLDERIRVDIDANDVGGLFTVQVRDKDYVKYPVRFSEDETGGELSKTLDFTFPDDLDSDNRVTFWVQFYADENILVDLVDIDGNVVDTVRIIRLSNGLGAPDGISAHHQVVPGHAYVNTMQGNLYFGAAARIYQTPALGPDLTISYNHLDGLKTSLRRGWRCNYDMHLYDTAADPLTREAWELVGFVDETGKRHWFKMDEDHKLRSDNQTGLTGAQLTAAIVTNDEGDDELEYTLKRFFDNKILTFSPSGQLKKITNIRGEKITVLSDDNMSILSIDDDYGRSVVPATAGLDLANWSFEYEEAPDADSSSTGADSSSTGAASSDDGPALRRMKKITIKNSGQSANFSHGSSIDWQIKYTELDEDDEEVDRYRVTKVLYPHPKNGTSGEGQGLTFVYNGTGMGGSNKTTVTFTAATDFSAETTYTIGVDTDVMTSMENPVGVITTYSTTPSMHRNTGFTRGSYTVTLGFDPYGLLSSRSVTEGRSESWTYDDGGVEDAWLLKQHTLTGAGNTDYTYETEEKKAGRVKTIKDPCSATTTFTYNDDGWLETMKNPLGKEWTYSNYTDYGQPQEIEAPENSQGYNRKSSKEYTDIGQISSETDIWGYTTSYEYNGLRRLKKVTRPGEDSVTTETDPLGRLVKTIDLRGKTAIFTNDAWGRRTNVTHPGIGDTTTVYTMSEGKTEVETKRGTLFISKVELDVAGRTTKSYSKRYNGSAAKLVCSEYKYDSSGFLQKVSNPYWDGGSAEDWTEYTRKASGWVTSVKDPEGHSTTTTYTPAGWVESTKDADNVGMTYTYDNCGRVLTKTNSAGGKVTTVYFDNGQVKSVTPSIGRGVSYTYEDDGMLKDQTDIFNKKTVYTYDTDSDAKTVKTVYDGRAGKTVIRTYDPKGFTKSVQTAFGTYLNKQIDPDGVVTQSSAPGRGLFKQQRDDLGRFTQADMAGISTTKTHFDPNSGILDNTTSALQNVNHNDIDAASGDTKSTHDSVSGNAKNMIVVERDARGNVTKYKDASGATVIVQYDLNGRRKHSQKVGDSVYYQWEYTPGGRLHAYKRNGVATTYGYNSLGMRTSADYPTGPDSSWTYDAFGLLTASSVGGRSESRTYDSNTRQLTRIETPEGATKNDYDDYGRLVKVTFNQRVVLKNTWNDNDTLDNTVYGTSASDPTDNHAYYHNGDHKSVSRADGSKITKEYDDAGRPYKVTYTKNATTTVNYDLDAAGNVKGETINTSDYGIKRTYDKRGRMTKEIQSSADVTNTLDYIYRNDDQIDLVKLNNVPYIDYTYDPTTARLTGIKEVATGKQAQILYDAKGRVKTLDMPDGVKRRYWWDEADRLRVTQQTAGATSEVIQYRYSNATGLLEAVDGEGYTIKYTYNGQRRLVKEVRTGREPYERNYTYDNYGNRLTMSATGYPGATTKTQVETFNSAKLPKNATVVQGAWSIDKPNKKLVGEGVADANYSAAQIYFDITKTRLGQISVKIKPDLTNLGDEPVEVGFNYQDPNNADEYRAVVNFFKVMEDDGAGQMVEVVKRQLKVYQLAGVAKELPPSEGTPGGQPATYDGSELTLIMTEDGSGHITLNIHEDDTLESGRFDCDLNTGIDPEWHMTPPSFPSATPIRLHVYGQNAAAPPKATFDDLCWTEYEAGPPETHSYEYTYHNTGMDRLHQVIKDGVVVEEYDYDAVGRITNKTKDGVTSILSYDNIGRLIGIDPAGLEKHTYSYFGASWKRESATWQRQVNGTPTTSTTTYAYDGMNCIQQKTGGVQTNYTYWNSTPLWETRKQGTKTKYFLSNGRGNITGLYKANGGMEQERHYTAYGEDLAQPPNPSPHYSRLGYRSQLTDATGLQYLRHRYYDPTLGRFMSQDPAQAGMNWQIYANGDPVNNVDPTGLDWEFYYQHSGKGVPTAKHIKSALLQGGLQKGPGRTGFRIAGTGMHTKSPLTSDLNLAAETIAQYFRDNPGAISGFVTIASQLKSAIGINGNLFTQTNGKLMVAPELLEMQYLRPKGSDVQDAALQSRFNMDNLAEPTLAQHLMYAEWSYRQTMGEAMETGTEVGSYFGLAFSVSDVAFVDGFNAWIDETTEGRAWLKKWGPRIGIGVGAGVSAYLVARKFKLGGIAKKAFMKAFARGSRWLARRKTARMFNVFGFVQDSMKGKLDDIAEYKARMMSGKFEWVDADPVNRISGYRHKGRYYIDEGHRRLNAAMEIFEETGDDSFIKRLLQEGKWEDKMPYQSRKFPRN